MSYFVYILMSLHHARTYVGQTDDIERRLATHNAGKVKSTKPWRPYVLLHLDEFPTRSEAMRRESWFKSVPGRKHIAELLAQWQKETSRG